MKDERGTMNKRQQCPSSLQCMWLLHKSLKTGLKTETDNYSFTYLHRSASSLHHALAYHLGGQDEE